MERLKSSLLSQVTNIHSKINAGVAGGAHSIIHLGLPYTSFLLLVQPTEPLPQTTLGVHL